MERGVTNSNHCGLTQAQLATIQRMAAEGRPAQEIADVIGCQTNAIYKRCRRHGWELTKAYTRHEWPQERTEKLKQLWAEGHSASIIGRMLGDGITRCAVLGKVHRLGLPPRIVTRISRARLKPTPLPEPEPLPYDPLQFLHIPLECKQLTERTCKWPLNDGGPFLFCGRLKPRTQPYCEACAPRAWTRTMSNAQYAEEQARKAKARKEAEAAKRVSGDTWGWRTAMERRA